ncbi:hypothetical protein D3C72_1984540 [compost metagenome]
MQLAAQLYLHLPIQVGNALAQAQPCLGQMDINPALGIQPGHRLLTQWRQTKAPSQKLTLQSPLAMARQQIRIGCFGPYAALQ